MKPIPTPPAPLSTAKTADLRALPAALERAYQSARELARRTDTYLVVQVDGQLVKQKVN